MTRFVRRILPAFTLLVCLSAIGLTASCIHNGSGVTDRPVTASVAERAAPSVEGKGAGGTFTDPKVCSECHTTQYTQWLGSMHHYAQASLTVEIINDFFYKRLGKTGGAFCVKCHTPIGTALGEPPNLANRERSQISMAGVSCDVCHSIDKAHGQSQGYVNLKPGHAVYGPFGKGTEQDPPPAPSDFHASEQRDLFKSSTMCQACHEVTVPNGLRLQETYAEWKVSPWAKEGVTCQSCHMGPIPGKPAERKAGEVAQVAGLKLPTRPMSDHSFVGVDYHWTEDFPLRGRAGQAPDDRTRRRNIAIQSELTKKRHELMRNAAKLAITAPQSLARNDTATVSVKIENTFTGHHFPGGFPWRQAWLEVTYTDANGKVIFQSGDFDANGDLRNQFSDEVSAGRVPTDRHLVNLQSQATVKGFRGNDVEVVFPIAEEDAPAPTIFPPVSPQMVLNGADNARIVKRGIPARQSRTYSYPIAIPADVVWPVTYRVRLLYRNYPPYYFNYFVRYYPNLKELLLSLKSKLEVYEVDAVTGQIGLSSP